ncbi:MAG: UbiD family decarboxylase [Acidilobaceae archaeon]
MKGGVSEYLYRIDFVEAERELAREYEPTRLILRNQGLGPALLFRVKGCSQLSASNLVDSREKLYRAIEASSDFEAYVKLLESMRSPAKLIEKNPPDLKEAERGLLDLPAIKFYLDEGGYYLTSSIFIACYEGICNASFHRVMVLNEKRAVARIVPRHLYELIGRARERGENLPVTIILGAHPAVELAVSSSPPLGVFELETASRLVGGLEVFSSPLHGNPVPLGAPAIIEAEVTGELEDEGPFVDIVGNYDRVRKQPVLRVKKVFINEEEINHVIVSGGLESQLIMGFPREAAIWEAVSRVAKVVKVRLTRGGGHWLHAVISIKKRQEGEAANVAMAAFTAHPSLKHVVVVDEDIDPDDPHDVEWAIAMRFQADKSLVVLKNVRGSTLDPSSQDGLTSKLWIDATKPIGAGREYMRGRLGET